MFNYPKLYIAKLEYHLKVQNVINIDVNTRNLCMTFKNKPSLNSSKATVSQGGGGRDRDGQNSLCSGYKHAAREGAGTRPLQFAVFSDPNMYSLL